jgi:hypothetical protein
LSATTLQQQFLCIQQQFGRIQQQQFLRKIQYVN